MKSLLCNISVKPILEFVIKNKVKNNIYPVYNLGRVWDGCYIVIDNIVAYNELSKTYNTLKTHENGYKHAINSLKQNINVAFQPDDCLHRLSYIVFDDDSSVNLSDCEYISDIDLSDVTTEYWKKMNWYKK